MRVLFILLILVVCAQAGLFEKFKELFKGKPKPNPVTGGCGDIDPKICKELKAQGFCTSWYHAKDVAGKVTEADIKSTCGKTCGLCK